MSSTTRVDLKVVLKEEPTLSIRAIRTGYFVGAGLGWTAHTVSARVGAISVCAVRLWVTRCSLGRVDYR